MSLLDWSRDKTALWVKVKRHVQHKACCVMRLPIYLLPPLKISSIIHWIYICSPSENDKCLKKGEVNENNSEIHQKPQNFIPCKSICILYVTFYVSWNVRLFAKYFNSFLVCPKCANRFVIISNGVRYCVINYWLFWLVSNF